MIAAALVNLLVMLAAMGEHVAFGGALSQLRFGVAVRDVGVALGSGVITAVLAAAFAFATRAPRAASRGRGALTALVSGALALWCAALMEEVVFRAFVLENLWGLGAVAAVLISSALFTVIHVPTSRTDRHALFAWFVGGVALSGAYLAGAPILVLTAAHFARNLGNALWVEPSPLHPGSRVTHGHFRRLPRALAAVGTSPR